MISEPFLCDRVNQIVNIDLNASLITIHDLELRLSQHHRNDKIPSWAESIILRIEQLESYVPKEVKMDSLDPKSISVTTPSQDDIPHSEPGNKESIKEDNSFHLLEEDKSQMKMDQITIDYKIDSIMFELERVRQLIQFRPTTSEFQLVVLSLNDIHRKMYDSLEDIAAGIRGTVEEKVAIEMDCFTNQLRRNEKSNTKRIQLSLDKTERLNKSILELSEASSRAIEDIREIYEKTNTDVINIKEEAERAESQWETSISGLQGLIESNRKVHQRVLDDLLHRCADDRFILISNSVTDVKDALEALGNELEINVDNQINLASREGSLCHYIGTLEERMKAIDFFIASHSASDMIEAQHEIERQRFVLEENHSSIEMLKSMMATSDNNHRITLENISSLEETINNRILESESSVNSRTDTLFQQKKEENDEMIKNNDITLGQIDCKLNDLYKITGNNKDSIKNIEITVKSSQVDIKQSIETSLKHESRLNVYSSDITKLESRFRIIVDDMTKTCLCFITEKHQELVRECIFL